jgi:hypothetical protein
VCVCVCGSPFTGAQTQRNAEIVLACPEQHALAVVWSHTVHCSPQLVGVGQPFAVLEPLTHPHGREALVELIAKAMTPHPSGSGRCSIGYEWARH